MKFHKTFLLNINWVNPQTIVGYLPSARSLEICSNSQVYKDHNQNQVKTLEVPKALKDCPGGSDGKKAPTYNAGAPGSIPGSGRSAEEGNGNPLQYSCLENPMDGGAWWTAVHGVTKSRTQLSDFTFTFFKALKGRGCEGK